MRSQILVLAKKSVEHGIGNKLSQPYNLCCKALLCVRHGPKGCQITTRFYIRSSIPYENIFLEGKGSVDWRR